MVLAVARGPSSTHRASPHPLQVTLDAKRPDELAQLLADVLGLVDASQRAAARAEPHDAAPDRIATFLRLLKFPLPDDA